MLEKEASTRRFRSTEISYLSLHDTLVDREGGRQPLAEQFGIPPQIAEQAINFIGPQMAQFGSKGVGRLGSRVGRFLK